MAEVLQLVVLLRKIEPVGTALTVELKVPVRNHLLLCFFFFFLSSYTLRYTAMRLRLLLHAKFPEVPEDDILKVVGNLLYYRYMNPTIVSPDAFDIVDVGMEEQLSPDQVNEGFCLTISNRPNAAGSSPF